MRTRAFSIVWFIATLVVTSLIAAHAGADPQPSVEIGEPSPDAAREHTVPVLGLYGL
jgi:hypothetical protein